MTMTLLDVTTTHSSFVSAVAATRTIRDTDKTTWEREDVERMELFVADHDSNSIERLIGGTVRLMAMAPTRLNEALHSPPNLVALVTGAWLGVAWQTKVIRTKRGTR